MMKKSSKIETVSETLITCSYSDILKLLKPDSLKHWTPSDFVTNEEIKKSIDSEFEVISAESDKYSLIFLIARPQIKHTITNHARSSAEIFLGVSEKVETDKPFIFIADFGNAPLGMRIDISTLSKESRLAASKPAHFFIASQFDNKNLMLRKFLSIVQGSNVGLKNIHFIPVEKRNTIAKTIQIGV